MAVEPVENLRPLHKDVIVMYHDINKVSGYSIIMEDKSENTQTHYCKVLRKSPNVTLVEEGDIIVLSWMNITEPFEVMHEGKEVQAVITTEDHIWGVVEE